MSETFFTSEEICAKLTTGPCRKDLFPQLEYNQRLRDEVKDCLNKAGYEFVDDPISKHFDARIKPQITSLPELIEKELGNGLTIQAKALIVILWCHLILPKFDISMRKELMEEPTVTEEQLYENYKKHIGIKQNLRKTLTLLRQYNFIKTIWGKKNTIVAGPRLTTAIDSTKMYNLVKDKVIEFIISENEESEKEIEHAYKELEIEIKNEGGDNYAS